MNRETTDTDVDGRKHHASDEAELDRLESNVDSRETESNLSKGNGSGSLRAWIITAIILGLIGFVAAAWIVSKSAAPTGETAEHKETESEHADGETGKEVKLDPESLTAAGIQTETVTQRPAIAKLYVTGAIELNPETTEMATPLVGGRIEKVFYGVGDSVSRGAVLAVISSPQLAQMHGKMHEAKTKFELAQRNLERVQKSENRVSVLQAKAKLDEADATLKRTRRLIELGAGAGKDLIAAETTYRTAKADYDFQSNIALNKELQEARAEVETAQVDLRHIEDEMRSLGVPVESGKPDDHRSDTSLVALRSPLSGVITERKFNAGAGIEGGMPVFSISNLGTVYVIANVPESNMARLNVGSIAEITSPSIGTVSGRVSYIDPKLDETTRTGRVRLEVPNASGKLRAGMFAEVGFYTGTNEATGQELVVPSAAIQRTGDKTVVFVPRENEPGAFEVREIQAGADIDGYTKVIEGLELGEKVVTKGSFTLKTQLEKGAMGDDH
ncbi:MAG: efflux RND transporter periplasmic adaptor subunit [Pyrinomonadaceae bacterium]